MLSGQINNRLWLPKSTCRLVQVVRLNKSVYFLGLDYLCYRSGTNQLMGRWLSWDARVMNREIPVIVADLCTGFYR